MTRGVPMVTKTTNITTAVEFADTILRLPSLQPATDQFARRWTGVDGQKERKAPWYRVQRDYLPECCEQQRHWYGYLAATCEGLDGKGKPHPTAKQFYMRVNNPLMLTDLAEASGI